MPEQTERSRRQGPRRRRRPSSRTSPARPEAAQDLRRSIARTRGPASAAWSSQPVPPRLKRQDGHHGRARYTHSLHPALFRPVSGSGRPRPRLHPRPCESLPDHGVRVNPGALLDEICPRAVTSFTDSSHARPSFESASAPAPPQPAVPGHSVRGGREMVGMRCAPVRRKTGSVAAPTVHEARRSAPRRVMFGLVRRAAVIDAADAIDVLVKRLHSPEPVAPEGVALVERMLSDGGWSPLYNDESPGLCGSWRSWPPLHSSPPSRGEHRNGRGVLSGHDVAPDGPTAATLTAPPLPARARRVPRDVGSIGKACTCGDPRRYGPCPRHGKLY